MFELSSRAQDFVQRTRKFIETEIEPVEKVFWEEVHLVKTYSTGQQP